jgi:phosphoribosylformylglycinamidine synthase
MKIVHYYRKTVPPHSLLPSILEDLQTRGIDAAADDIHLQTESCFNVSLDRELTPDERTKLEWLLAETFDAEGLQEETSWLLTASNDKEMATDDAASFLVEFGPRMTFTSAFSSNAISICQACQLPMIQRLELSKRYQFTGSSKLLQSSELVAVIKSLLHDRMTEQEYTAPLTTFDSGAQAKPVRTIRIMEEGRAALEALNNEMGLGFDDHDLDYYTDLFKVRYSWSCDMHGRLPRSLVLNLLLFRFATGKARTQSHRRRML